MNKYNFLQWWLIICIQALFVGIAIYFGIHKELLDNDKTYLSFVIIGVWILTSLAIGWLHTKTKDSVARSIEVCSFIAETCLAIGMIGTVIGLIIMIKGAFVGIDATDIENIQIVISNMAIGMGTALYTTVVGLIFSIFIRIQLVNLEFLHKDNEI